MKLKLTLFLILLNILLSCDLAFISKEDYAKKLDIDNTVVYVGGANSANYPCYWRNGVRFDLSGGWDNTFAYSLFVDNGDVYAIGYLGPATPHYVCYWKNGIQTIMTDSDDLAVRISNSIFVYHGDVYITGFIENNTFLQSCFWKNGIRTLLPDILTGFTPKSYIFIYNDDVYFASKSFDKKPAIWKNGIKTDLENAHPDLEISGFFVYKNSVYVSGIALSGLHCYWKDGVQTILIDGSISSIFVYNDDIYLSGWTGSSERPCYWKNGIRTDLPGSESIMSPTSSIFVFQDDIYVAGESSSGKPCYWKNGVQFELSDGNDIAKSIFVTKEYK